MARIVVQLMKFSSVPAPIQTTLAFLTPKRWFACLLSCVAHVKSEQHLSCIACACQVLQVPVRESATCSAVEGRSMLFAGLHLV